MVKLSLEDVVWIEPKPEWTALADRIGSPIRKVGVVPGEVGAWSDLRGTVLVGERLLDQLTDDEIDVVIAHELGHAVWLRTEAAWWALIAANAVVRHLGTRLRGFHPLLIYLYWREIEKVATAMLFPVRWCREYGADTVAAQQYGVARVQVVLTKLRKLRGGPDSPSGTHPPFNFRVVYLALQG